MGMPVGTKYEIEKVNKDEIELKIDGKSFKMTNKDDDGAAWKAYGNKKIEETVELFAYNPNCVVFFGVLY